MSCDGGSPASPETTYAKLPRAVLQFCESTPVNTWNESWARYADWAFKFDYCLSEIGGVGFTIRSMILEFFMGNTLVKKELYDWSECNSSYVPGNGFILGSIYFHGYCEFDTWKITITGIDDNGNSIKFGKALISPAEWFYSKY